MASPQFFPSSIQRFGTRRRRIPSTVDFSNNSFVGAPSASRMATPPAQTEQPGKKSEEAPKKSPQPPPPPPPEKPLTDDCCGSGCDRCVWDIYYEELEAYNKLYGGNGQDGDNCKDSS